MKIYYRYKKLSLWNKIQFWGAIIGIISFLSFLIVTIWPSSSENEFQIEKDAQIALIHKYEISHFFIKFRICLKWTLPSRQIDVNVNNVFEYADLSRPVSFQKLEKSIIYSVFTKYDFAAPMNNYLGDADNPTGFSNLLGILEYLDKQINEYMNKHGANCSVNMSTRIEYLQRFIQSSITSIRLDLRMNKNISIQTVDIISDLFMLLKNDFLYVNEHTKHIKGGYPIAIGKVTKVGKNDGEILIETQFSSY